MQQCPDHDLLILLNERGKEVIRRLETFDTDITRLENVASNHSKNVASLLDAPQQKSPKDN